MPGLDVDPLTFNRAFLAYMDTEDRGREKAAAAGATFVRDRLREEAAVRRIMNPERLDPTDQRVIPSLNSDTLVVRKDLEPNSRAFALTFGTQPDAVIVTGRRIDIPLFTVSSEMFQIREQHLLAYEMPVTKIIEENTGKDVQEIEDLEWLIYSQAAVGATGLTIKGIEAREDIAANGLNTGFRGAIQRPDIVDLGNLMLDNGNRKRMERVWVNDVDFNNVLKWTAEDTGDDLTTETTKDGYKYDRLLSKQIVRTVKTDMLQTGNMYGYAAQQFLGFFFILNNIKFYLDKVANLIRWQAWEDIALSIANISSVVKMELYNQVPDTLPTEETLFQQTNPADSGGAVFPQVTLS